MNKSLRGLSSPFLLSFFLSFFLFPLVVWFVFKLEYREHSIVTSVDSQHRFVFLFDSIRLVTFVVLMVLNVSLWRVYRTDTR
eukprot:m.306474 g.306474  ORF g.306474 m.306474 type:complete len:82 (+) comp15923_c0_seq1:1770-2015(+)